MSRYSLESREPRHEITVGWDRPMRTFFAHVAETAADDVVLNPGHALDLARDYAVIPPGLETELLRDALADVAAVLRPDGGGEALGPTDLHQRLRALDAGVHQLTVVATPLARRSVPETWGGRSAVRSRLRAWIVAAVRVRALVRAVEDVAAHGGAPRPDPVSVMRASRAVRELAGDLAAGRSRSPATATTDGAGSELLRELAGLHDALVTLHDISAAGTGSAPPPPEGGDRADAERTPPGAVLGGVVTGPATAVLTLVDAHGRQHARAHADGGRYEIAVPHPGVWQLIASAPGARPHAERIVVGERTDALVHDLVLEAAPGDRGRTPARR